MSQQTKKKKNKTAEQDMWKPNWRVKRIPKESQAQHIYQNLSEAQSLKKFQLYNKMTVIDEPWNE